METNKDIRNSVLWFAEQMENKLKVHDSKGGWDECNIYWLYERIKEELKELIIAIDLHRDLGADKNDIIDEAADVANFAMMIADITNKKLSNLK